MNKAFKRTGFRKKLMMYSLTRLLNSSELFSSLIPTQRIKVVRVISTNKTIRIITTPVA